MQFQDYMAALGAAIITRGAGHRVAATFDLTSSGTIALDVDPAAEAEAVHAHAARCADPESWIWADHNGRPLFAPARTGATPGPEWLQARQDAIGALPILDQQMILGIGPERSPLDMTPRQQGQTIVSGRLRKLASDVASLGVDAVAAQLADVHGVGEVSLRWGYQAPTAARAWCALWALSAFPVADGHEEYPEVRVPAWTRLPGSTGRSSGEMEWVSLPAWSGRWSVAKWTAMIQSGRIVDAATPTSGGTMPVGVALARLELSRDGVAGLLSWPIAEIFEGSINRWTLDPTPLPCAATRSCAPLETLSRTGI
jgi:hypothetical protein